MNVYDDLTLFVDDNPFPWQNPILNVDVDAKDGVIPLDALIIINYINLHPGDTSLPDPPAAPPPYYDVSGDNAIAAIDALQVINYLNDQVEGEGEAATSAQTISENAIVAHFGSVPTADPTHDSTSHEPEAEHHRWANEDADDDWRGRTGQRLDRFEGGRRTHEQDDHRCRDDHDVDHSIDSILDDFVPEVARRWFRSHGRR
jgi:hypothetical protein